ncbi:uncharacterized protein DSM5745_10370 [Aspergillus mulundensis]|uniref:Aminoglycoside phosphotransferase domain-containing protein n=1 Tax=Aspergillus mulundensis TaxID=1810919 RepID=A0A3D8QJ10_9EURO|nr:Uncharacterized protein DSM5745_10370 [Aspergillus mulundensis]RDW61698.1 Uncharacterized protein DSM5745_10370 [Aspergillus mulundensis]
MASSPLDTQTRRLLHGEITYAEAKESDSNILHALGYREQKLKYFTHLYRHRKEIEALAAHHLGLASADTCHAADVEDWVHGSFNVCIRVDVDGHGRNPGKQLMMRLPLPYRIGENRRPGNADEKVRCEAATYVWLQMNCPTVSIPQLYGFGLSTGQTFTLVDNLPFIPRIIHCLRQQLLKWLNYQTPSLYVQHPTKNIQLLGTPYLLIEYIDPSRGRMLSETWADGRQNVKLRTNLFHGLSRIMLAMARVPLPRIGSFTLDSQGYLSLTNRPLTLEIQQLENEDIPVDISRSTTHSTVDSYAADVLAFHESRLRNQPNAVHDLEDGFYQLSALMVMRSVWSCFFRRDLLRGPFLFNLTDLNQSNIFVDKDWNVKYLIDLEWACSLPAEMIHPPYWLSNQVIDMISINDYEPLHSEFVQALAEEEENEGNSKPPIGLSSIMQQGWGRGTFWYSLALSSPTALFKIFYDFIQPRFSTTHDDPKFWQITMPYWGFDAFDFIERKVKDKERYDAALREEFLSSSPR